MSIKSKLAVIAALTTLVAAPAFAIDQQASEAALDNPAQVSNTAGAYAWSQPAVRGFDGAYASTRHGDVRNSTVEQPETTFDFGGLPAAR
jgi:hypothetical protein